MKPNLACLVVFLFPLPMRTRRPSSSPRPPHIAHPSLHPHPHPLSTLRAVCCPIAAPWGRSTHPQRAKPHRLIHPQLSHRVWCCKQQHRAFGGTPSHSGVTLWGWGGSRNAQDPTAPSAAPRPHCQVWCLPGSVAAPSTRFSCLSSSGFRKKGGGGEEIAASVKKPAVPVNGDRGSSSAGLTLRKGFCPEGLRGNGGAKQSRSCASPPPPRSPATSGGQQWNSSH